MLDTLWQSAIGRGYNPTKPSLASPSSPLGDEAFQATSLGLILFSFPKLTQNFSKFSYVRRVSLDFPTATQTRHCTEGGECVEGARTAQPFTLLFYFSLISRKRDECESKAQEVSGRNSVEVEAKRPTQSESSMFALRFTKTGFHTLMSQRKSAQSNTEHYNS